MQEPPAHLHPATRFSAAQEAASTPFVPGPPRPERTRSNAPRPPAIRLRNTCSSACACALFRVRSPHKLPSVSLLHSPLKARPRSPRPGTSLPAPPRRLSAPRLRANPPPPPPTPLLRRASSCQRARRVPWPSAAAEAHRRAVVGRLVEGSARAQNTALPQAVLTRACASFLCPRRSAAVLFSAVRSVPVQPRSRPLLPRSLWGEKISCLSELPWTSFLSRAQCVHSPAPVKQALFLWRPPSRCGCSRSPS